jgi:hypothetical protein
MVAGPAACGLHNLATEHELLLADDTMLVALIWEVQAADCPDWHLGVQGLILERHASWGLEMEAGELLAECLRRLVVEDQRLHALDLGSECAQGVLHQSELAAEVLYALELQLDLLLLRLDQISVGNLLAFLCIFGGDAFMLDRTLHL